MCKYITIFYIVDEFCKIYEKWVKYQLLNNNKQRFREGKLSLSEEHSIMIFYHFSAYKHLKAYYQNYLSGKKTGIYYVDSTHFAVCKNIRINANRIY